MRDIRPAKAAGEANVSPVSALPDLPAPVTARAVWLGLLGAGQIIVVQVYTKVRPGIIVPPWIEGPYLSWYAILPGVVFFLFALSILNAFLKRFAPRLALRPAEFAVIFGITTVAAAIAAQDEAMQLLPVHLFPLREAQAATAGEFAALIPGWLAPHDPSIVEPYYLGNTSFWTAQRLTAWAVPLLCWLSYLTALGATIWAWNVILRRRWMDGDRLTFPNVQLPLTLCREAGFGGNASGKFFWGGVIAAFVFESLNPIQQLFPTFPNVPATVDISPLLSALPSPWNALSPMILMWPTVFFGICYFIPTDILFSAGGFYVVRKLLEVLGRAMGWRELGGNATGFPFAPSQAAGAWVALFFLLVWAERHHLRRVLDAALPGGSAENFDDAHEFASYRVAGRVLMGGTLFLICFSIAEGMSPIVALVFYALFWALQVTMTRVYCQVGPPTLELYFLNPQDTMANVFGTFSITPASALHLSLLNWLTRTACGQPMGHQMAAFLAARRTNAAPRPFGRWILAAFVFGAALCLLTYLHYAYRVGEDQWRESGWKESGAEGLLNRAAQWVGSPKGPKVVNIAFMFVGAGVTLALAKVSAALIGFPLHPVGFALAMCYGVEYSWPAFLCTALLKSLLLRYGGRAAYDRFVPVFLGLTLGGLLTPVLWGFAFYAFGWFT